jgi:biopolymer transport protein ExbD
MAIETAAEGDIVSGINVTPLVDVCLVLVIIFMVTAPLLSNPPIKVDLPAAHTQEGHDGDKITVTLGKDGKVAVGQNVFPDIAAGADSLKAHIDDSDTKIVVIRADQDALNGWLTDIMGRAKDDGALNITIATLQKK